MSKSATGAKRTKTKPRPAAKKIAATVKPEPTARKPAAKTKVAAKAPRPTGETKAAGKAKPAVKKTAAKKTAAKKRARPAVKRSSASELALEDKVVLDDSVTPEVFAAGVEEYGWPLVAEHPATNDSNYEQVYALGEGGETKAYYVEDHFVRVRYVVTRGPEARAVADGVRYAFAHADAERLLEAAEEDGDLQTMVDWLMSSTVLGDHAGHERLRALVERRLAHPSSAIRRAALISVSWLEWPDFQRTVERLAEEDPHEDVRRDASSLAESYALRAQGKL
ncbi:MAG: hypothetical protein QM820_06075 [Minicystis sp.]